VSVADQIRAITGAPDASELETRIARLEAEHDVPIAAFAAIAEIVTFLLREDHTP